MTAGVMIIVGVFMEYDGPRRALISTDIAEALKLLHELLARVRAAKNKKSGSLPGFSLWRLS